MAPKKALKQMAITFN